MTATASHEERPPTRVPLGFHIAGAVAVVLALAFALAMTAMLRSSALSQAQSDADRRSVTASEQMAEAMQPFARTLREIDLGLAGSASRAATPESELLGGPATRRQLAETLQNARGALLSLSIVDTAGQVLASTERSPSPIVTAAGRALALAAMRETGPPLHASEVSTDDMTLALTARLARGGRAPPGILVGIVPLEPVQQALTVAAGDDATATLVRDDGVRVLHVSPGRASEAAVRTGDRIIARRSVPQAGLFVEVSRAEWPALATWRRQAIGVALSMVLATGCAILMLAALGRQMAIQRHSRAMLERRNSELQAVQLRLERQTRELQTTADALRAGEALLAERSGALNTTLQYIDQGIVMVDGHGVVAVYNQRAREMLGLPEELLSSRPQFSALLQYQWETAEFRNADQSVVDFVRAGGMVPRPHVYQRQRPNGRTIEVRSIPLPAGGIVRTYTDITERKLAEAQIERAALVDELTGLSTRLALRRAINQRHDEAAPGETNALLYLSLDRFRLLNDARGHEAGDRLLIEIARRLTEAAAPGDIVSRVGGDEFALLHRVSSAEDDACTLAATLLQRLSEPHMITGIRLATTVSIGVAVTVPGAAADDLLRNADIALNRAKDAGRNQFCRYEPAMASLRQERFQLEQSLREALGSRAFRLAYQPIVSVESGRIIGYEALLRWTDPVRGEVSPAVFIPVAEATGLIVPLGTLVLEWACFEAASWPNQHTIAVNLSPAQFQGENLLEVVKDVLARSGLAPCRLELEVTEGMLLENTGPVLDTMRALREVGIGLTLDDFGAGHAGLSYLRRFPFQKIKIDGSFIRNLGRDRESDAIVEAILLLGQRLALGVVAEGVETEAQLEMLREMHCPFVQGYLTGRPMPPEMARALG